MNQTPPHTAHSQHQHQHQHQHQCPWETMALSSRLSCVMSIFPRHLWGYIITEPMFSPEEMYEVDAYFGYSRRYRNLQPRTYWDSSSSQSDNFQLPQMSFVHHVVNHHNVNIVAHQYRKGDEEPLSPVSPKPRDSTDSPDMSRDPCKEKEKQKEKGSSTGIEPVKRRDPSSRDQVKQEEEMEQETRPEKRVKLENECKKEPAEPSSTAQVEPATQ